MGLFNFGKKKKEKERLEKERLEKERLKREESEKDLRYIKYLIQSCINELNNFPYKDKLKKEDTWIFTFETGTKIKFILLNDNKFEIIHEGGWWIVTTESKNLLNELFSQWRTCRERKPKTQTFTEPTFYAPPEPKSIQHPLKDKYNLLARQIKLRQDELIKFDKTDPKRKVLENELNNYKIAAKKLKDKIFADIK